MKPRDYFAISIRVTGLWMLLHSGLWNLLAMICYRGFGVQMQSAGDDTMSFVVGVVFSIIGLLMLRGGGALLDFA